MSAGKMYVPYTDTPTSAGGKNPKHIAKPINQYESIDRKIPQSQNPQRRTTNRLTPSFFVRRYRRFASIGAIVVVPAFLFPVSICFLGHGRQTARLYCGEFDQQVVHILSKERGTSSMRVRSEHERVMHGSIETAAEVAKTYGASYDRVHPNDLWPRVKTDGPDGPPAVGRIYTRSAAKFVFTSFEVEPKKVHYSWKFIEPAGFNGCHATDIEDIGNGKLRFKTFVEIELRGLPYILLWFFVMKPFHNAVVEDCLDKAEKELGNSPRMHKWGLWVRVLRRIKRMKSVEYQQLHQQAMEKRGAAR